MIVTCAKCNMHYDDFDHWTYCPHERFSPSPDVKAMQARGELRPDSGAEGEPKRAATTILEGFTQPTTEWLGRLTGRVPFQGIIGLPTNSALHLANELKVMDDREFPGGKWATIQHLEACIASQPTSEQLDLLAEAQR
jgi:hypothetical protein